MQVLIFQIVVFLIISFAGFISIKSLNIVSILLIIFTICMVNTSPLMILQFFTIIFAYSFSLKKNQENTNQENYSKTYYSPKTELPPRKKSVLELIFKFIINTTLLITIVYGIYKFTIYHYLDADDIGTIIFYSLSYIFVFAFALFLFFYFVNSSKENIKEILSKIN
jgi:hypothetical protein